MAKLTIVDSDEALAQRGAERMATLIEEAIARDGSAVVSLTGGSTPRAMYEVLGSESYPWRARIDWSRLHLFWGDERHVPPDHPDSNFGMANRALIGHVPIPPAQVHRMRGEIADAREAARAYEVELQEGFHAAGRNDTTFDVMLLGLGEDAHIGSIFPGSDLLQRRPVPPPLVDNAPGFGGSLALAEAERGRVAGVWAPHLNAWRITLTPDAILDSRVIVMFVGGAAKADAVYAAIEERLDITRWPAQLLRDADDRLEWIVDAAAARRLTKR